MTDVLGFPLTPAQWDAVSGPVAPAVIIAGAGSGKTTCMAARVAWLVGSGYAQPHEVLGLTFTRKATGRLLTSIRSSLHALQKQGLMPDQHDDLPSVEPTVLTYHAFAAQVLSEQGIRLGIEPGAAMLTDGAAHQRAFRLVQRTSLPLGELGRGPVQVTRDLLDLDGRLAEMGITPAQLRADDERLISMLESRTEKRQKSWYDLRETAQKRILLSRLVDEWRALKLGAHVSDFSDQTRLALDLALAQPEVVAQLRERYRVVLLDEYQDTSIAQRRLMQALFGDGHPVLAVGDPFQAIYGWRAASVRNITDFPAHFPISGGRPATIYPLLQNRRSGPAILHAANAAAQPLRTEHAGVGELEPTDDRGPGHVSVALFATVADEVTFVVDEIERTHAGGAAWSQIAVLGSRGDDLALIDRALHARGIPTEHIGAAALLAQPAVVDLRAILELLHDPTSNAAFVRIAAGRRWQIGARDLAALGRRAAHLAESGGRGEQETLAQALDQAVQGIDDADLVSLIDAVDDLGDPSAYSPQGHERLVRLGREIHDLRRHAGEGPVELITRVLRTTGLDIEIATAPPDIAASQQRAVAALLDLAAEATDLDGRISLGALLSRLRDVERFDVDVDVDAEGRADAVQLITMYKAKGLEYPYVFVPFLCDGSFPTGRSAESWVGSAAQVPWTVRDDATALLLSYPPADNGPTASQRDAYRDVLAAYQAVEARRLAYVALTRAERGLVVSGHWWGPTQKEQRGPHPVLLDVHAAVVDGAGTVVHWEPAPDGTNPARGLADTVMPWPAPVDSARAAARNQVASRVRERLEAPDTLPGLDAAAASDDPVVREWDRSLTALLDEARALHPRERSVRLPDAVSASLLMRALADPDETARDLARPMPAKPAPAARRGTALHAWIEARYGQQALFDPDDLPGAADADITTDAQLEELKAAFENGPFAAWVPVAVEEPFALLLGGRVINGRMDAVFERDGRYDVIDWKTGSAQGLDPLQLAIYRLAWSQLRGVDVDDVDAGFAMVATGEVLRPDTSGPLADLQAWGATAITPAG